MTPPSVLVNTYFSGNEKSYIDPISKVFIITQLSFGIIRLPLFGEVHYGYIMISAMYTLVLACSYGYVVHDNLDAYPLNIVICIFCIQCIFFMTFNVLSIGRMQRYYNELNVFDKEVGCRPRVGKASISNLLSTIVMMLYIVIVFALPHICVSLENLYLGMVPFPIIHILEVNFCGHLLSLLLPRLRLINYYMELSLTNSNVGKTLNIEQFGYSKADSNKTLCKMDKVMNLYHNMIKSYNYLIDSIKWQLLVTIVSSFLNILSCCYRVSLTIIKEDVSLEIVKSCTECKEGKYAKIQHSAARTLSWHFLALVCLSLIVILTNIINGKVPLTFMITYVGLLAGIMFPLFSPCMLGDKVHNEVRRLRELLASRLYENQLDKASRGLARALLAWTETRDLSFSLLRMLNIDISLPFKFVGLLVTYLIILLQFQKVINP